MSSIDEQNDKVVISGGAFVDYLVKHTQSNETNNKNFLKDLEKLQNIISSIDFLANEPIAKKSKKLTKLEKKIKKVMTRNEKCPLSVKIYHWTLAGILGAAALAGVVFGLGSAYGGGASLAEIPTNLFLANLLPGVVAGVPTAFGAKFVSKLVTMPKSKTKNLNEQVKGPRKLRSNIIKDAKNLHEVRRNNKNIVDKKSKEKPEHFLHWPEAFLASFSLDREAKLQQDFNNLQEEIKSLQDKKKNVENEIVNIFKRDIKNPFLREDNGLLNGTLKDDYSFIPEQNKFIDYTNRLMVQKSYMFEKYPSIMNNAQAIIKNEQIKEHHKTESNNKPRTIQESKAENVDTTKQKQKPETIQENKPKKVINIVGAKTIGTSPKENSMQKNPKSTTTHRKYKR